jgi:hypothetical protein
MARTDARPSAYRVFIRNLTKIEGMSVKRSGVVAPVERSKGCLHYLDPRTLLITAAEMGFGEAATAIAEIKAKLVLD